MPLTQDNHQQPTVTPFYIPLTWYWIQRGVLPVCQKRHCLRLHFLYTIATVYSDALHGIYNVGEVPLVDENLIVRLCFWPQCFHLVVWIDIFVFKTAMAILYIVTTCTCTHRHAHVHTLHTHIPYYTTHPCTYTHIPRGTIITIIVWHISVVHLGWPWKQSHSTISKNTV